MKSSERKSRSTILIKSGLERFKSLIEKSLLGKKKKNFNKTTLIRKLETDLEMLKLTISTKGNEIHAMKPTILPGRHEE